MSSLAEYIAWAAPVSATVSENLELIRRLDVHCVRAAAQLDAEAQGIFEKPVPKKAKPSAAAAAAGSSSTSAAAAGGGGASAPAASASGASLKRKRSNSHGSGHRRVKKEAAVAKPAPPAGPPLVEALKARCLQCSNEKVKLATHTYDLIDNRIKRLDQDLKHFEAEIRFLHEQSGSAALEAALEEAGENALGRPRRAAAAAAAGAILQQAGGADGSVATLSAVGSAAGDALASISNGYDSDDVDARPGRLELAVDPSEPVYCSCRQVAFGNMVSCDNPECMVEWFHYQCVGLSAANPPPNSWMCGACTQKKRRGLIKC